MTVTLKTASAQQAIIRRVIPVITVTRVAARLLRARSVCVSRVECHGHVLTPVTSKDITQESRHTARTWPGVTVVRQAWAKSNTQVGLERAKERKFAMRVQAT